MNEFHFQNPGALLALVAVPGLWIVASLSTKWANSRIGRFAHPDSLRSLLRGGGSSGMARQLFFAIGISLAVLAWARPQGNPVDEVNETAGLDLMVLLDVSKSMDAEDVFPSRLKKAKKSIVSLMDRMSGDRIGILAFAGSAVLVSPLTSDYEAVKTFLDSVDTSLIENQGTDLEQAVDASLKAMARGGVNQRSGSESSSVFVVMSDGETHTEKVDKAANQAKEASTKVFSIAFGTEKGAPIPVRDQNGELRGYKRSEGGESVVTKVETSALRTLADITGGAFYHSTMEEGEIADILRRTDGLNRSLKIEKKVRVYEEYFQIPLAAASLFLLLSIWPGVWIPRRAREKLWPVAVLMIILPSVGLAAPWDSSEKKRNSQAKALLESGKADEARKIFEELQVDHPESPEVANNLGLALALEGKGEDARRHFSADHLQRSAQGWKGRWNHAGSFAREQKTPAALAEFSRLVRDLSAIESRTKEEDAALQQAKKNLEHLARQNQEQQKKQQQGGSGSDGEKGQNKKQDQQNGDQDSKKDPSKDEKSSEGKSDDEKKDGKNENTPPQNMPREGSGKKPFKEREDLSEQDAQRMLETLRNQEGKLQRKFLKKKGENSKVRDHGKDW